jgi:hypothetical protein
MVTVALAITKYPWDGLKCDGIDGQDVETVNLSSIGSRQLAAIDNALRVLSRPSCHAVDVAHRPDIMDVAEGRPPHRGSNFNGFEVFGCDRRRGSLTL